MEVQAMSQGALNTNPRFSHLKSPGMAEPKILNCQEQRKGLKAKDSGPGNVAGSLKSVFACANGAFRTKAQ